MRHIFGNVWVWLGLAIYGTSLVILWRNKSFAPEDAISLLVIFGIAFPLLAWATTRRARPLTLPVHRRAAEMWLLFACLIGVTLIVWARTKNLLAVIIIHAATDLLPNFAQFLKTWGGE